MINSFLKTSTVELGLTSSRRSFHRRGSHSWNDCGLLGPLAYLHHKIKIILIKNGWLDSIKTFIN